MTLEWIGRGTRRTELEQPLLVNEGQDDGRPSGWRVVAAESGAADPWRFRFRTQGDERSTHEVSFGGDLDADVHLFAIVLTDGSGGATASVFVDGRRRVQKSFRGTRVTWRAGGAADAPPFEVFEDPAAPSSPVYAYLRELRLSQGARTEAALRDDARRLGYSR
jgi:hypothetical protein